MEKRKIIFILILVLIFIAVGLVWRNWQKATNEVFKKENYKTETDQSLAKIKKSGKIIIGTSGIFEPMSFRDKDGNLVGYDIDLAKEIAAGLGVEAEFYIDDFTKLFSKVKEKETDIMINAVTITEERLKSYEFSDPYFNNGQDILLRLENEDIKGPEDLAGKKIGVWRDTTCEAEAHKYVGDGEVIVYDNHEEVEALKKGEVDAVIIDQINAMMISGEESGLKFVGKMFSEEYYGVVTNKENSVLIAEVNKIIKELKRNGKLSEFESKWMKKGIK